MVNTPRLHYEHEPVTAVYGNKVQFVYITQTVHLAINLLTPANAHGKYIYSVFLYTIA
jgi:hypothetical protein